MGQPWYPVNKNPSGIAAPKLQVKKSAKSLATSVPAFFKVCTSASDTLLASAGASAHVDFAQTLVLEAGLLNAGSVVRIRGCVNVADASGTDTLEVKVYIGSTTLLTTTAFDPDGTTDIVTFDFTLVARANASATSSCIGFGAWTTIDGSTVVTTPVKMAATNLATDGALTIKASAKWSSTTASTAANLLAFNVEVAP
jgi:hypothetical protein